MSYVNDKLADLSLDCHPRAWAILHLLADVSPEHAGVDWNDEYHHYEIEVSTWPWYNGRERGFCVAFKPSRATGNGRVLYVTFGEERSSDDLFVDHWHGPPSFNAPTVENMPPGAYKARINVRSVEAAVRRIVALVRKHYEAEMRTAKGYRDEAGKEHKPPPGGTQCICADCLERRGFEVSR